MQPDYYLLQFQQFAKNIAYGYIGSKNNCVAFIYELCNMLKKIK